MATMKGKDAQPQCRPRTLRALTIAIGLIAAACAGRLTTTEVISAGRPVYPDSLRAQGIEGRVVVLVVVDSTGQAQPGTATVLRSPHPGFNQAAIDFVNGARFRPARYHGRPVAATVTVPIDFKIDRVSGAGVFTVDQVDQPPVLVSTERAAYPAGARTRDEVQVLVEAVIDTTGRAEAGSVRVVSTPGPEFGAPAVAYVSSAPFRPGQIGSRKVRVRMTVVVPFGGR